MVMVAGSRQVSQPSYIVWNSIRYRVPTPREFGDATFALEQASVQRSDGELRVVSVPIAAHMGDGDFFANPLVRNRGAEGENVDGRIPGFAARGPGGTTITLTSADGNVVQRGMEEQGAYVFVAAGQRLYKVKASDHSVKETIIPAAAVTITALSKFDGQIIIWLGNANDAQIITNVGGDAVAATLATMTSVKGYVGANAQHTLHWRGNIGTTATNQVSSILSGDDAADSTKWSSGIKVGNTTSAIVDLAPHGRQLIACKPDGLFGVDSSRKGTPLTPELERWDDGDNFKGTWALGPFLLCPHQRGLLQWSSIERLWAGPERYYLNNTSVRGRPTAVRDLGGGWFALALEPDHGGGTGTFYLCLGRPVAGGEEWDPRYPPYVWHLGWFKGATAHCHCLHVTDNGLTNPELWYAVNDDVGYARLGRDGSPEIYDGNYLVSVAGGFQRSPVLPVVDGHVVGVIEWVRVRAVGVGADDYWEVEYDVDRAGSFTDVDQQSNNITAAGSTRKAMLDASGNPKEVSGRLVQWQWKWTGTTNTARTMGLRGDMEVGIWERPSRAWAGFVIIDVSDHPVFSTGIDARTAQTIQDDLEALADGTTPRTFTIEDLALGASSSAAARARGRVLLTGTPRLVKAETPERLPGRSYMRADFKVLEY